MEGRIESSKSEIVEKRKQIEMNDFIEATSSTIQNLIIKMVTTIRDNIQTFQDDEFGMKNNNNHNDHSYSSLFYMNHNTNPLLIVFFPINELILVEKKLPIYFPKTDLSKSSSFLPK